MNKNIKNILTLKNIILFTLGVFCILTSFYLYGRNSSKVFKDEYMPNIFVEEEKKDESIKTMSDNIINTKVNKILVEIKGEVNKPDVYEIDEGSIIRDLIDKAGGLTSDANINNINRAEKLKNNQLIVIPNKNDINTDENKNVSTGVSSDGLININNANLEELQKINGIGEVKAQSIIDYREKNGGFKSIEDIKNVDGIGSKTFEKIKEKICI